MTRTRPILILCCIVGIAAVAVPRRHTVARAQSVSNGAALFASNCAACHGSDGRSGERAPDIASRREVVSRSDAELTRIVANGLSGNGMPAFGYLGSEQLVALVRHLRTLQGIGVAVVVPGDPNRGEGLFFGKAGCSDCHMMQGRGGYRGSDLSGWGLGRSVDDARKAIVDPDRKLSRASQYVSVVVAGGQRYQGFIRNEDNFSLVLQGGDGTYQLFRRDLVARIEYSNRSSMPRDYQTRLSDKELDDLISYILKAPSAEKEIVKEDDE